jgi:hypothetical protein
VFDGREFEHKLTLKDLGADFPSDWSAYDYLVMELRTSSPQRFALLIHDKGGLRRLMVQPFGQNVWMRASVPLRFFQRRDRAGFDMASVNNRPANSFWMSVWGPFGSIDNVEALGIQMDYPINQPVIEIRSTKLSKEDAGSEFLEKLPVVDEFGQWAHADWPRKVRSLDQLKTEWAAEEKSFAPQEFGYCQYGGYLNTKAKATGFFRVEKIDGKWWFVDPDGHLYLSMVVPGMGAGGGETRVQGRENYFAALPPAGLFQSGPGGGPGAPGGPGRGPSAGVGAFRAWNLLRRYGPDWRAKAAEMEVRRVRGWGLTTGPVTPSSAELVKRVSYLARFNTLPRGGNLVNYLGMPDVYSEEFARALNENAASQLPARKDDPFLVGYFIGNEPPWPGREPELIEMFLNGPATPAQDRIKAFLAQGETPVRRREFVVAMFEKYLAMVGEALKKYDPNHLNLGIRFGGSPQEYILKTARAFDVYSVNTYEYAPLEQMKRAWEVVGMPILIGEFHFGVPADGLGAGLVQVRDQKERGTGYRYYVEQAASLAAFVGAAWFVGTDESVTGRNDGENYNIGFIDVTERPYLELVKAAKHTLKRLHEVHAGKIKPFARRPLASGAGTPASPWTREDQ